MLNRKQLETILDAATSTGADFAEVFVENTNSTTISMSSTGLDGASIGTDHGVGIRIVSGLKSIYTYTNDTAIDNLLAMTKRAVSALLKGAPSVIAPLAEIKQYNQHKFEVNPMEVAYNDKLDLTKMVVNAGMQYDKEISQMRAKYLDFCQNVQIANSTGLFVEDSRVKTRLMISAFAQRGDNIQNAYVGPGASRGFEFYDKIIDPTQYAQEAAKSAKIMLDAKRCPGGIMDVVIENGFGGLVFHEACGHSLEATSLARGNSEFSGKLGEKIASDVVTLIDDGSLKNAWGSLGVDDEGMPTQKNVLIEQGILKSYMVDMMGAKRMGLPPTGSGRRQSYRFAPTSRMTNTYIANGTTKSDDIIPMTNKGLYVKKIGGGSVNPVTGTFNFSTVEAYLIENGKIVCPVKGATLIGNGAQVLKQVELVGDNLAIGEGYCYSTSGALFICSGQPTVKISNMTVGGVK